MSKGRPRPIIRTDEPEETGEEDGDNDEKVVSDR
jgi:hypothetical protein